MASSLLRLPRFSITLGVRGFSRSMKPVIPDPERPARPLSAWMRYLDLVRNERAPNTNIKDLMAVASERWKALPIEEKRKYVQPYEEEKKMYEERMKAYVDSGKKEAWSRDPARPKSPLTGYLMYLADFRTQKPEMKMLDAAKAGAVEWKQLTPEKKKPYLDKYAAAKEQYAKDLEAYKKSGKEEAWKEKVGIAAKEEKLMKISSKSKDAKDKLKAAKVKEKEKLAARKHKEKERLAASRQREKMRNLKKLESANRLKQKAKEREKAKKEKTKQSVKQLPKQTLQLARETAKKEQAKTALERAKSLSLKEKGTILKPLGKAKSTKLLTKSKT